MTDNNNILMRDMDKPWTKFYIDPPIKTLSCEKTLYETYVECNKDNWDGVAYFTKDKAVTHYSFKKAVDDFASGIYQLLQTGDVRVGALLNCYEEAPISLLAVNKIGGVIKFIDFTKGINDIIENIIKSHFDALIIDENFMELVKAANVNNMPTIIVRASADYNNKECISFENVIKKGSTIQGITSTFFPQKPVLIISSSGTTGAPKPIVHSNETVNMAVNKILYTDLLVNRKNVMINAIPPFIGLGIVTTVYTSLISGMGLIFIGGIGPEDSVVNTGKFIREFHIFRNKFNLNEHTKLNIFAAPIFYRYIASCDDIKDLSFVGGMLSAGSRMGKDELDRINLFFSVRGCDLPVCNGYGQNEMCGAVSLNSISHNVNGSGGYPTIGTNVKILDPSTKKEVPIGQEGKICEQSTSQFLCYEEMENETKNAFIYLDDGSKWFDTKDLGYMDNEGFIHITGRMTRVIVRQDMKLFADGIENKIKSHSNVIDCAVIAKQTDVDEEPIAFIKVRENTDMERVIGEIQIGANSLSDLEMPVQFITVNEIPYLGSGKVDYMSLKKLL